MAGRKFQIIPFKNTDSGPFRCHKVLSLSEKSFLELLQEKMALHIVYSSVFRDYRPRRYLFLDKFVDPVIHDNISERC